jgi:hypothetical protein
LVGGGEARSEIYGRCGFSHSTFLIRNRNDSSQTVLPQAKNCTGVAKI